MKNLFTTSNIIRVILGIAALTFAIISIFVKTQPYLILSLGITAFVNISCCMRRKASQNK